MNSKENSSFCLQQWLYVLVGLFTIIPIILLTFAQMNKSDEQFAISLLFLVHSISVLISIFFTAFRSRISDALLTILTILLLFAYVTIHFYVRFLFDHSHPNENFIHLTLRLAFVLILFIFLLPWTSILIHTFKNNDDIDKQTISPRVNLFSWFLKLDFILIISSFTLTIENVDQFHFLLISLAVSLASLWLSTGKLSTRSNSQHWFTWTVFYVLSILQIFYLFYIVSTISFGKIKDFNRFAFFIIKFLCLGSNLLTHILTIFISCSLISSA